jgi:hypothetical protein
VYVEANEGGSKRGPGLATGEPCPAVIPAKLLFCNKLDAEVANSECLPNFAHNEENRSPSEIGEKRN